MADGAGSEAGIQPLALAHERSPGRAHGLPKLQMSERLAGRCLNSMKAVF